jgi:dTDP-4-dehydrorhamnose reductase
MMRFLVTGASGLLGLNFCLQYAGQHEIIALTHRVPLSGSPFQILPVELAEPGAATRVVLDTRPDWIVHCAAVTNLEQSEKDPAQSWRLNAEVPGELALAARQVGAGLVHISTDAVFDGIAGNYSEGDLPHPLSVYAQSKLAGEQAVASANPDAIIARVNFYGWSTTGRRSLAEFFYYNLVAGKTISGFHDIFFCPLEVQTLSEILMQMITRNLHGLYHVVSRESLSKYDFGCRIAALFDLDAGLIQATSWKTSGLVAQRAPNLNLRSEKLAQALGRVLPDQAACLQRFFRTFQDGLPDRIRQFASSQERG